jgi:hypothetical protein
MIKNKASLLICFCVLLICLFPLNTYSKIGVGVGIGKIEVDQQLRPGQTYNLPDLPVINTGDEPSSYQVSAEYRENVQELRPDKNWINFYPDTISLEPNSVKMVKVTLDLPIDAKPGDYFVFLQAQPIKSDVAGGVSTVNIAAAAKLYFTIVPANIFMGVYYKLESLWDKFYPWDLVVVLLIIFIVLVYIFRKKFNIQISLKQKKKRIKKNKIDK